MAKLFELHPLIKSFVAGEDVSEKTAAKLETSGDPAEVVTAGAGEAAIGIFLESAEEGAMVRVLLIGITTMIRGSSAITAGTRIVAAASGHAAPMGTGAGTYNLIGTALGNPGATGEEFPVLVNPTAYVDTTS